MRISDWSSDVCSSDLEGRDRVVRADDAAAAPAPAAGLVVVGSGIQFGRHATERCLSEIREAQVVFCLADPFALAMIQGLRPDAINLGRHYAPGKDRRQTYREIDEAIMAEVRAGKQVRSEEHTSELQSLMRISYAVFCLNKKTNNKNSRTTNQ